MASFEPFLDLIRSVFDAMPGVDRTFAPAVQGFTTLSALTLFP